MLKLQTRLFSTTALNEVRNFNQLPGPKPSVPLLGTSWQYLKFIGRYDLLKLHEANVDKFKCYGPILREEYEWRKPVVHLIRPDDFEQVFRSQGLYPHRPFVCHYRRRNTDKYANVGISNQLGEEWFEQRKLLAPVMLKLGALDVYLPQLAEICDDLVNYIQQIGSRLNDNCVQISDLQSTTYRLSLESICMLCLDSRMGCLSDERPLNSKDSGKGGKDRREDKHSNDEELRSELENDRGDGFRLIEATRDLFSSYQELYYSPPLWKLFETKAYQRYVQSEDAIYQIADKYVGRALIKLKADQSNGQSSGQSSLLKTLLSLKEIDERDVRTLIIDFISGGINTTSNSLSFILLHLANNPDAQSKLFAEIKSVLAGNSIGITGQHLNQMKYLKACIKESFRLNSTIPCLVRLLPEEIVLNGYRIPAKTTIFSHFFATCRSETYFEQPTQYRPERWLGKEKQKISPFALLPFGFGTKMCTGRRFSEIQLYLAVIKLISNYELISITKNVELSHSFILMAETPIAMAFRRR